ncbi:hypothetical protein DNFV4_02810 [Nitrospira tepida]|uniref:Lipoprotein LPP20-like domain-containing protein n=1 Tax=Nitrospira tepida TaxID=2973512 RepID=A0AA86N0B4_9BACT|nr:LPP20 family lipoprotein [Nitrospira tepida]CAI4032380.1 hypothetical protein DNFV4_02810 [Nitrospira tepida]
MNGVTRVGREISATAWLVPLILSGCGWWSSSSDTDWMKRTNEAFPPAQYLVGHGEGESRTVAAERAYAAVAKIFKAEINSQAKEWESYLVIENKGRSRDERRLTLDNVTSISTDKVLANVRVLDEWYDDQRRLHHALAGMNRSQAEAATLERINELDATIAHHVEEARQVADPLAHARSLKRAITTLIVREAHNADLRVIRPSGQGLASSYRVAELTGELERFLTTGLPLGLALSGDYAEPIGRALIEGLAREGLSVTEFSTGGVPARREPSDLRPVLLIKGLVRLWPTEVQDPAFRYVRWCSDFLIVETETGRVLGALSKGDRVGHVSTKEATAKALRLMQQDLSAQLTRRLTDYMYGDLEPSGTSSSGGACPRSAEADGPRRAP